MAWTGSAPNQTYQRTDGVRTGAAVNVTAAGLGVNDTAELADARENDFAEALNLVLKRDGGNQPSADLPMNTHKLTGMANGSARTDSVSLGQVQDGNLIYAEAGGTANAITLTTAISCSPVEGMVIGFVAEADSTSSVTVNLNGGGALALQVGGAACVAGEINNGGFHQVGYDGTRWQLLNPLYPNVIAIGQATGASGKVFVFSGAGAGAMVDRTDLGVPSGTKMLFQQTSAPTGWTKDTTHNNKALRVVSGSVSSGGSVDFTTAFASQPVTGTTDSHAITEAQLPAHRHFVAANVTAAPGGLTSSNQIAAVSNDSGNDAYAFSSTATDATIGRTSSIGSSQGHTHTFTGNAINLAVSYVDLIIATKN